MLPQHILIALVAAVSAVPLNINLGAYSPALVVGDGEISLGSTESASELMATLAQGAQQQGEQQGEQQGQQEQEQQQQEQQQEEGEQPAEKRAARRSESIAIPAPNVKRDAEPEPINEIDAMEAAVKWIKRDINSFNAALTYAREAMQNTPKIELGTENAGVGILVNAGLNVPANSAANGQGPAKRSEVVAEESEAPKMTLVAITEV